MTDFQIERGVLTSEQISAWAKLDVRFENWPVVYMLDGPNRVYVGESLGVANRFRQHMGSADKKTFRAARIILDPTFNKSVCLDLEAFLIQRLSGDGTFEVANRNVGISDRDYFGRDDYRKSFSEIFEHLRSQGVFSRSLAEIENSNLFKLSPFKALSPEQEAVILDILEGLFDDLIAKRSSQIVIAGEPGTGKTVVAVYLMKLLSDIQTWDPEQVLDADTPLAEFFTPHHAALLRDFRMALVVPQKSLRKTIERVFAQTPGLSKRLVISAFEVGSSDRPFDLLVVDETHRLRQSGNQPAGPLYQKFSKINVKLFGEDDPDFTQLDWITKQSSHQILLLDAAQTVHTADLPARQVESLLDTSATDGRRYRLASQMRVRAGSDYIGYVRSVLAQEESQFRDFGEYDLRLYDDLGAMREAIRRREQEVGLARLVAGFAWTWKSKADKTAFDIEIGDVKLRWNQTDVDWVSSSTSAEEVGVIHTIQGYDLNYAGVIIGPDLRFDPRDQRMFFDRDNYCDPNAARNMPKRGITFTDDDILGLVRNIYAVLLTRGVLGTYLFACDEPLRQYLAGFFPRA